MKKLITLLTLTIFATSAFAVFETRLADGASTGYGDVPPEIGISGASLFGDNGIYAGGGYKLSYGHSDFSEMGGYAYYGKDKIGRMGVNFSSFSVADLTSETEIGISYKRALIDDVHNKLEFALRADIYSLSYEPSVTGQDLGNATAIGLTGAMQTRIYERTRIAILAENLTGTSMGKEDDIDLPRSVTGLLGFAPYSRTEMAFYARREAGKDWEYAVMGYAKPIDFLSFRAGIVTNPDRLTAGIGLHYSYFTLDYGLKTHPVLPLSHVISLNFNMGK